MPGGAIAGDALGSLVEFQTSEEIKRHYPGGVRNMKDGGTWNTIAGQPTDDSEMALMLARLLISTESQGAYCAAQAKSAYLYWLNSKPFDCGHTVYSGLSGNVNAQSQANGALMRISPLGIFCAKDDDQLNDYQQAAQWAMEDARLTHPHPLCQQINALFVQAIAWSINHQASPHEVYMKIVGWADMLDNPDPQLKTTIEAARTSPPADYLSHAGWVLVAFHNTLWQLLHAPNLEEGIVDTIGCGGDTDTNAAICGALLGAVYGLAAIPRRWRNSLQKCRPAPDNPKAKHARPECFWPTDALEVAESLLGVPGPR